MRKYKNIKKASELFRAIAKELLLANIRTSAGAFGILAEGNGEGEVEITVVSARELRGLPTDEIADMQGYGWGICNDLEDVRDYARAYFG